METLRRSLVKTYSELMQRIYTRIPAGVFPHIFNAFSFH